MAGERSAAQRSWAVPLAAAVTLIALVALALDWPAALRGPAPYPPEWQWERRNVPAPGPWAPALFFAAGLVALVAAAGRAKTRRAAAAILAAGTGAGLGLGVALVAVEPGGALQTYARRALSRTVTSYLTVAASDDAREPIGFLQLHADALPRYRKEAKHAATHPPGPVLFYRGLIALAEAVPAAARATLDAARMREEPTRPGAPGLPARAAAVWGPLLIALGAVLTAWPVAGLARALGLPPGEAAQAGLFWLLLPGPLLQAPQFDQALALPVAVSALLAALAAGRAGGPSLWLAAGAGLSGGVALFLSYGAAAPLAISCGAVLWALAPDRRCAARLALLAALVAAAVFASTALLGHAPLRAASTALAIHREAYTAQRSYALWLFFNPVDLFVFVGPAVAVLFALAAFRPPASADAAAARFARATAVGLGLLLLSGALRGEAGRILIPLMPALLLAALTPLASRSTPAFTPRHGTALAILSATWAIAVRATWEVY